MFIPSFGIYKIGGTGGGGAVNTIYSADDTIAGARNVGLSTLPLTFGTSIFSMQGANGRVGVGTANAFTGQVTYASDSAFASYFVVRTASDRYGLNHNNGTVELTSYITSTASSFGTTTNHSLRFYTNDFYRGSILANGNFSFGTISDLSARVGIQGVDATSSNFALKVQNSVATEMFNVSNNGKVSINELSTSTNALFRARYSGTFSEFVNFYTEESNGGRTPRTLFAISPTGNFIFNGSDNDTDVAFGGPGPLTARFNFWGGLKIIGKDGFPATLQQRVGNQFFRLESLGGSTIISNYDIVTNNQREITIARAGPQNSVLDSGYSKISFNVEPSNGFIYLHSNNIFLNSTSGISESLSLIFNSFSSNGTNHFSGLTAIKNVNINTTDRRNYLSIGEVIRTYRDINNDPDYVQIHIPTLGLKTIEVGAVDSAGAGYRMLRVLN